MGETLELYKEFDEEMEVLQEERTRREEKEKETIIVQSTGREERTGEDTGSDEVYDYLWETLELYKEFDEEVDELLKAPLGVI